MKALKEFGEQTPLVDALKLWRVLPTPHESLHLYIDNQLTGNLPINFCSVVSNIAISVVYCCGAKLVRKYHGVGLLTPGVGLFHLVMSYCGIGDNQHPSDRESMPTLNSTVSVLKIDDRFENRSAQERQTD